MTNGDGNGPGADTPVFGNYHWRVSIDGIEAGKFFSATPPSIRLDNPMFTSWANNGVLVDSQTGGRKATWSPVTLSRGGDDDKTIWQWVTDTRTEGAKKHAKKVTLECLPHDSDKALFTWTLNNATITSFSHSGANAQTQEILVNTLEITYEDAVLS